MKEASRNVDPLYYPTFDGLLELIENASNCCSTATVAIPPLHSAIPLSYRTEDGDLPNIVETAATTIEDNFEQKSSWEQQTGYFMFKISNGIIHI